MNSGIEYAARKAFERAGDTGERKWDECGDDIKDVWRTYVREVANDLDAADSEGTPKGPYQTLADSDGWFVQDVRKLGRMVFSGSELQCNDVRDVLNRGEIR